ncbi:MAG: acyl carrier protein, partial [Armatimonadota bacterium]
MSDNELKAQLKELVVERLFLNVEPQEIGDEDQLMEKFGIDSVQLFEIIVGLEEVFEVSMAEEEFSVDHFESINSIAAFV